MYAQNALQRKKIKKHKAEKSSVITEIPLKQDSFV